jgi:DNA-binding Lrp family transcriptional regulator
MKAPELSELDRQLLGRIQSSFPLVQEPYAQLAHDLGAASDEVHRAILGLRRSGVIRRIGGSFVPAPLGHLSTLVGSRTDPDCLEAVAAVASAFPEVTHNYERDGEYNLWFTVIAPAAARLEQILQSVRGAAGVRAVHSLPCLRVFKIRVRFDFGGGSPGAEERDLETPDAAPGLGAPMPLDDVDRRLICRACGDIGESVTPFADVAGGLGLEPRELLGRLGRYRAAGAMRRFGAVIRHRTAGITGNGMSVWNVPEADVERVGSLLARRPEVSHCYERPRIPGWPYNLFGMVHGVDRERCGAAVEAMAAEVGIADRQLLFSGREFKKSSMVYFPTSRGACAS